MVMEELFIVLSVVWGILGIVLFFKIWGMTNDVKKILSVIESKSSIVVSGSSKPNVMIDSSSDSTIKEGDIVYIKSKEKKAKVLNIENGNYLCMSTSGLFNYGFIDISDMEKV